MQSSRGLYVVPKTPALEKTKEDAAETTLTHKITQVVLFLVVVGGFCAAGGWICWKLIPLFNTLAALYQPSNFVQSYMH